MAANEHIADGISLYSLPTVIDLVELVNIRSVFIEFFHLHGYEIKFAIKAHNSELQGQEEAGRTR